MTTTDDENATTWRDPRSTSSRRSRSPSLSIASASRFRPGWLAHRAN